MDLEHFYDLIWADKFNEAHRWLDDELNHANQEEKNWLHYRRVGVYLGEKRYQDAIEHLKSNRGACGTVTSVHDTLAMIYDITGQDDLALSELETAPYEADRDADPLTIADAKFYRLYFRAMRRLPIYQTELDAFPSQYETYLPADGKIRGALVRKVDIITMIETSA